MGVAAGYVVTVCCSDQHCNAKYSHSPAGDDRDISDVLSVLETLDSPVCHLITTQIYQLRLMGDITDQVLV